MTAEQLSRPRGLGASPAPAGAPRRGLPKAITSPTRAAASTIAYAVLAAITVLFLLPMLWVVFASVNAEPSLRATPPSEYTLEHFATVLTPETMFIPLWNSVLLSGGAAVTTVVVSILAAYPLSRFNLRFKRPLLYTMLFATGLPVTAIMVPVYSMFVQANLLDSRGATTLFLAASSLPFGIWLMKNFLDGIPVELEEAAWVDGASSWQSLRLLVVPLAAPGMAVVGIFTLVMTWGNFFVPFLLLKNPDYLPAAVRIYSSFGQYGAIQYGSLAAYSLIYSLPVILVYIAASRALGSKFTMGGALKG